MSLPSQPQAYGAGMAGGSFDPVSFIKRPQVILRIVSWVSFKFGCINFSCKVLFVIKHFITRYTVLSK